jgi:hypothetical protein
LYSGRDLELVWDAPTTTDRDRKELMRLLVEEVVIKLSQYKASCHPQPTIKTDEDTIDLLRRLAVHYTDEQIAGILNRQGRLSARGERFTAVKVQGLRYHRDIPRLEPTAPLRRAANPAHRQGRQGVRHCALNPPSLDRRRLHRCRTAHAGAPWHIRMSDELKSQFVEEAPAGWVMMWEATKALGVSRQTVLQRVKRGKLRALHLRSGRRKGLRIELPQPPPSANDNLFDYLNEQQG